MLNGAIALAVLLHASPEQGTIDSVVRKELSGTCAKSKEPKQAEFCKLLGTFSKGAIPKLPANRFFSIGHLFTKEGPKDVYVFFISEGAGKEAMAAADTLRPEDQGERVAAEAYLDSIAEKKRDTTLKLHQYLSKRAPMFPLHPVKVMDKSLTWESGGAGPNTTWVRQQGNHVIGVAIRQRGEAPELLVFQAPVD